MPVTAAITPLPRHRAGGFTLIEVLIAMLVLMVGILGVAGIQLVSFQNNQNAYLRTQATYIAADFLDRIRANPEGHEDFTVYDNVDTASANLPADPGCIQSAAGCTPAELAAQDVREWASYFVDIFNQTDFRPALPAGRGTVARGAGNEFTVRVFWEERDWATDVDGNAVRGDSIQRSVELRTVLQ